MFYKKSYRLVVSALGCAGFLFGGHVACVAEEPGMETGSARALYVEQGCYQCHGYDGQGGFAGPRIAPQPLPFDAFATMVRYPPNLMPAYSKAMLSDEQLALIHEYLESLPPLADEEEIRALLAR